MPRFAFPSVLLLLAGLLLWLGGGECELNVAPFSRIRVDGAGGYLNPNAPADRRAADVVVDGLFDNQYDLELPPGDHVVEVESPVAATCHRIVLIGAGGQREAQVAVSLIAPDGSIAFRGRETWVSVGPKAPTVELHHPAPIRGLTLEFTGDAPVHLNSVLCFARVQRLQAWLAFASLQLVAPWLVGAVTAAAFFGWGRLLVRVPDDPPMLLLGKRLLVGAAVVPALGAGWLLLPAAVRDGGWGLLALGLVVAPGAGTLVGLIGRRRAGGLFPVVGLTALLLLATVAVDTTLVANRRVKPMDHLHGLLVAQHLLADAPTPNGMNLRPWYVPTLAAPVVRWCGDAAYWLYLGQVAWLNALALTPIAMWAERWNQGRPASVAALVALMPVFEVFHFPGQRPFAAGLVLAAVYFWTDRSKPSWWFWGGLAAALGVLAHPGSLFVLPPAALYFLATAKGARLRTAFLGLVLPLAAYAAWSVGIRQAHPDTRNDLLYYPIMRTLNDAPPEGGSLAEIVKSLPADHWRELAWNRVRHLRHYLWSDNPWHTEVSEVFRPVSLPSALGVVLTLALPFGLLRGVSRQFLWLAVLGPLLFFHAHIGQAFPQFHILPLPFVALALVAAARFEELPAWVRRLALLEWLARRLFPLALLVFFPLDEYGWFGRDPVTGYILGTIPVLIWLLLRRHLQRG